jgi:hypothetical protein
MGKLLANLKAGKLPENLWITSSITLPLWGGGSMISCRRFKSTDQGSRLYFFAQLSDA